MRFKVDFFLEVFLMEELEKNEGGGVRGGRKVFSDKKCLCLGVPGRDSQVKGTATATRKDGFAIDDSFERSLEKNLSSSLIFRDFCARSVLVLYILDEA